MATPSPPPAARKRLVGAAFLAVLAYTFWAGRPPASGTADARFREVAGEIGATFEHRPTWVDAIVDPVAPHVTAVGAAVAVLDADADGRPDLYALTSAEGEPSALLWNRGDGTFEDVAAAAGVADVAHPGESVAMGSVWADANGDGRDDGFLFAWGRQRLFLNSTPAAGGAPRFADASESSGLSRWMNSNSGVWIDHDRDGALDLYVGGYFPEELDLWHLETSRIMTESFEFARNAGPNRLFRGRGDGTFEDVTEGSGAGSTRWTFAAVAADFDRDGWPDLYVANDYGPEELYLNRGGERFELATGVGLTGESKSGMCVALGDVLSEGRLSVYVTNISQRRYLFQGNNLRVAYGEGDVKLLQFAEGVTADCGWAWGAQFGDLDDDGLQDLVVANGFLSASRDRDYWYFMAQIGGASGELIQDATRWAPIEDRSLSGFERTRVLFNRGRGRFVEAGEAVGIDDTNDGRAVALFDLEGDGDLDVAIASQNGPLLVYRNETENEHSWIAFDLVGTRSNRSAIGAEVELAWERRDVTEAGEERWTALRQLQVVCAGTGFSSQNQRSLHFGLGAAPRGLRATVRWPSGEVQVLEGLAADVVHTIEEPE